MSPYPTHSTNPFWWDDKIMQELWNLFNSGCANHLEPQKFHDKNSQFICLSLKKWLHSCTPCSYALEGLNECSTTLGIYSNFVGTNYLFLVGNLILVMA